MGLTSILLAVSSFLLKEWEALYKILKRVFPFIGPRKGQGIYDILDYETTLELSATGKTATFLKRQKVQFLQDNIISFQDYAWGEGEMFDDYQCSPGIVADRYFVGDRWNILISLRETKSQGDIEEFLIQSTFKDSYVDDQEWHQIEIRHHTQRLKMSIIFPKKRHCQRAILHLRRSNKSFELGANNFNQLPDGRQVVSYELSNATPLDVVTLRWDW